MKIYYLDIIPYGFETEKIYDYRQIMKVVDDCCDDFESQICENCKHLKKNECMQMNDWDCYNDSPTNWTPPKDFGCNKFVRKDNK